MQARQDFFVRVRVVCGRYIHFEYFDFFFFFRGPCHRVTRILCRIKQMQKTFRRWVYVRLLSGR